MPEKMLERETPLQLYKQAAAGTRHLLVFMKLLVCSLLFVFQRRFPVSRYKDDLTQETPAWWTAAGAISGSDAAVE